MAGPVERLLFAETTSPVYRYPGRVLIQTSRGTWACDAHQPIFGHGGNARSDEEVHMSDTPHRQPPPGTKPYYSRPEDWANEGIDAWASAFVDAVLGPIDEPGSERDDT